MLLGAPGIATRSILTTSNKKLSGLAKAKKELTRWAPIRVSASACRSSRESSVPMLRAYVPLVGVRGPSRWTTCPQKGETNTVRDEKPLAPNLAARQTGPPHQESPEHHGPVLTPGDHQGHQHRGLDTNRLDGLEGEGFPSAHPDTAVLPGMCVREAGFQAHLLEVSDRAKGL